MSFPFRCKYNYSIKLICCIEQNSIATRSPGIFENGCFCLHFFLTVLLPSSPLQLALLLCSSLHAPLLSRLSTPPRVSAPLLCTSSHLFSTSALVTKVSSRRLSRLRKNACCVVGCEFYFALLLLKMQKCRFDPFQVALFVRPYVNSWIDS